MSGRPFFRNQRTAVLVGVVLFVAGSWALHDAWDGRGREVPPIFRPFTGW